jgi:endonuclease/exonuclease/phosphatase family metal-dependent hydrolase
MTDIRVLTWNVHGGVGLDGVRDFSRIVDHVVSINPDIVALQEVDGRARGGRAKPMQILEDRLGQRGVSAATLTAEDGDYGQVLVSRWALTDVETLDLSIAGYEPRRAIAATARTPDGDLRILATHLGLRFGERKRQVATLCEAAGDSRPAVLMGDFNDWMRYRSAQSRLEIVFPASTRIRTFPARAPLLALDRIFCRPADLLVRAQAVTSAPLLSDHLPLLGQIRPRTAGLSNVQIGPSPTVTPVSSTFSRS